MSDRPNITGLAKLQREAVEQLVRETGVTEEQARELISLLGLEWSSLLREARLIAKSNLRR